MLVFPSTYVSSLRGQGFKEFQLDFRLRGNDTAIISTKAQHHLNENGDPEISIDSRLRGNDKGKIKNHKKEKGKDRKETINTMKKREKTKL